MEREIFKRPFVEKSSREKSITGDYYSEFKHFDKYAKQIDSIANAIEKIETKPPGGAFNFVDVGSHDGELTDRLLKILSQKNVRTKTYTFEPDKKSSQKLEKRFRNIGDVKTDNLDFNSWLEKYGDSLKDKVDLLLNSHTFYHFPKETWESVIRRGSKLLSDTGKHVIIIDSQQTSINKIKESIDKAIGVQKKIGNYGEVLFGSHLEKFLNRQGITYEHKTIEQPIVIPSDENSLQNFARILGFVFRHESEDILKFAKKEVVDFMNQSKKDEKYIFPRVQDVFILKK